jgi:topoisomerase IV subunit A
MSTDDLKEQMQTNFLQYASYVILDRAIPDVLDGLKPVQRRILYTLHKLDNGRLHKVANVVGQTMALHPHGDAAISDALVNLAQKGFLLDLQGNFGNPLTGDPAAASRYIEARLSALARESLFHDALTEFLPSYDGRAQEPVCLPCKLPLLLMQGAEGIAVGMSTKIFPHNFVELLEAQIDLLEGKEILLVPDFPSGGLVDASAYEAGRGKLRVRAKLTEQDEKTVVIQEVCFGTTTESLIRSIDEAAKKGKIKIESIHDYTAENVHIEIRCPRGQYARDLIPQLYAFTDCQVVLTGHCIAIKDGLPWEGDVHSILRICTERLQDLLRRELELERNQLMEKIFDRQLERIFIEEKIYKQLESASTEEEIDRRVSAGIQPFHHELLRVPTSQDRARLCAIPIRRISKFDADRNRHEIARMEERIAEIEADLKRIPKVAIQFLRKALKKFGKLFPRHTQIDEIEQIDRKAFEIKEMQLFYDPESGFVGTAVKHGEAIRCTNQDKLLMIFEDGTYQVTTLPEKLFLPSRPVHLGPADRTTVMTCVYRNGQGLYGKRFVVDQFIMEKVYRFFEEGDKLIHFTSAPTSSLKVELKPQPRQRVKDLSFELEELRVKGVTAKGIRLTDKPIAKVKVF